MEAVFELSPVQVGTLVNKVVLGEISLRVAYLSFPLSVSFHQCPYSYFIHLLSTFSSVGIATDYGLDGPGSNPGGDEIFRPFRRSWGPPASYTMGTGSFPGVNCGRGVLITTHPLLVPRSWKSRATWCIRKVMRLVLFFFNLTFTYKSTCSPSK